MQQVNRHPDLREQPWPLLNYENASSTNHHHFIQNNVGAVWGNREMIPCGLKEFRHRVCDRICDDFTKFMCVVITELKVFNLC